MLWVIRSSFQYLGEEMLGVLYLTFVGPHLEYRIKAASPWFKYEEDMLERVRRQGTQMAKDLPGPSCEDKLKHFNLFSLFCLRL